MGGATKVALTHQLKLCSGPLILIVFSLFNLEIPLVLRTRFIKKKNQKILEVRVRGK